VKPYRSLTGQQLFPVPRFTLSPERAVTDDSGAADDGALSSTAERVLKFLRISRADGKGKLNPSMLRMMPSVLQLIPDHCQAALDELDQAGLLAGDGTDLYLVGA
jgi:hypothetical protein